MLSRGRNSETKLYTTYNPDIKQEMEKFEMLRILYTNWWTAAITGVNLKKKASSTGRICNQLKITWMKV